MSQGNLSIRDSSTTKRRDLHKSEEIWGNFPKGFRRGSLQITMDKPVRQLSPAGLSIHIIQIALPTVCGRTAPLIECTLVWAAEQQSWVGGRPTQNLRSHQCLRSLLPHHHQNHHTPLQTPLLPALSILKPGLYGYSKLVKTSKHRSFLLHILPFHPRPQPSPKARPKNALQIVSTSHLL